MADGHISNRLAVYKQQFAYLRKAVLSDVRKSYFTASEKSILTYMCGLWWHYNPKLDAAMGRGRGLTPIFPAVATIAKKAKVSERAVRYALRLFEEIGIIKTYSHSHQSNDYIMLMDEIERAKTIQQKTLKNMRFHLKKCSPKGVQKGCTLCPLYITEVNRDLGRVISLAEYRAKKSVGQP